jgi:hypothetical protein
MSIDPKDPDFDPWKAEAAKENAAKEAGEADPNHTESTPSTRGIKRQ